jgi:hypothetical protein
MNSVDGDFGEKCGLGWTIGEEVVMQPDRKKRLESVRSLEDSCLMQFSLSDLELMTSHNLRVGAGQTYEDDHNVLMNFFENNFVVKQEWREKMGVEDRELKSAVT